MDACFLFQKPLTEGRSQYNIKRLRGLVGGLLVVLAPMMVLLLKEETVSATFSFVSITFFVCIVVVILANSWAKNKPRN